MPGATATEEPTLTDIGGGSGDFGGSEDGRGRGGDKGGARAIPQRTYLVGVLAGVAAIVMFFASLASAFIVRKGAAGDWQPIELPRILWFNTLVLLASSATIEKARRCLSEPRLSSFRRWWAFTTALGLSFLTGQLLAWRQLARAGVYLASNPSSSFFYLLTGAHGLHLLGGVVALVYVAVRSWQHSRMTRSTAAEAASIYWHGMDGLWVFLFFLLYLGG
jgi:cytochrome c oxidase subunit 3